MQLHLENRLHVIYFQKLAGSNQAPLEKFLPPGKMCWI